MGCQKKKKRKKEKNIPLAYRKLKEISPYSHFLKLEMGGY